MDFRNAFSAFCCSSFLSKWFELKAANSLARLWQSQGKIPEAYHLLHGVYSWFTEGFDTIDMRESKELLEELNTQLAAK